MMKKLLSNTVAKKITIFTAVFVLTCVMMGNKLNAMGDRIVPAATGLQSSVQNEMLEHNGDLLELYGAAPLYVKMDFPLNGEYPAVTASPIPARPLVDIKVAPAGGFVYCGQIPLSKELQIYTYNKCVEKRLEYELVLALMWRESRFQTDAVNNNTNGTQDSGIMQINDVNREWLWEKHGIDDLLDPVQNIEAGTIMLSNLVRQYGAHDALMAYQYGEQGMQEKLDQGVVTNDQITILLEKRDEYRAFM